MYGRLPAAQRGVECRPGGDRGRHCCHDDGGIVFTPGLMFYLEGKTKIGANLDVWSPQTGGTELSFKVQTYLYF